jgi:predicted RecA/RadA family phage recombinase
MKNFIQPGDSIEFTAPGGGVVSGTPVLIGGILVVPGVTAAATVKFNGMIRGVFLLPKAPSQAWAEGALVYWDSGNARCTTAGPGNLLVGFAVEAVGSGATLTTGKVMLHGVADESTGT